MCINASTASRLGAIDAMQGRRRSASEDGTRERTAVVVVEQPKILNQFPPRYNLSAAASTKRRPSKVVRQYRP